MTHRVRIKDVAEKANVSTGTVDRVIHNRGKVAPEVKAKVLRVMKELGFERNPIASALAMKKTFRVVALLPDYKIDPYWEQPFSGIEDAHNSVKHFGLSVEYHFFDLFDSKDFLAKAEAIFKNPPNGILIPPLFLKEGKEVLERCAQKGIQTIIFNTYLPEKNILSYIGQDSYQSGVLAARLMNFGLNKNDTALILNLSKGSVYAQHLLEKEQGFKDYFEKDPQKEIEIVRLEFEDFNDEIKLKKFLMKLKITYPNLGGIFFTNSRAHLAIKCAPTISNDLKIIGFDLIEQNIRHLKTDKINFLINQNPIEQGYLSVMSFFNHFVKKSPVEQIQFLPLDIIVKENFEYYQKRGYAVSIEE